MTTRTLILAAQLTMKVADGIIWLARILIRVAQARSAVVADGVVADGRRRETPSPQPPSDPEQNSTRRPT